MKDLIIVVLCITIIVLKATKNSSFRISNLDKNQVGNKGK